MKNLETPRDEVTFPKPKRDQLIWVPSQVGLYKGAHSLSRSTALAKGCGRFVGLGRGRRGGRGWSWEGTLGHRLILWSGGNLNPKS